MRPAFRDDELEVWIGDAFAVLPELPAASYGGQWSVPGPKGEEVSRHTPTKRATLSGIPGGVRRKSLLLAPYRLAIALCDAGWILRDRIVWSKTNGIPESAKDRFAVRDEVLFRFTLERFDDFDLSAVLVPAKPESLARAKRAQGRQKKLAGGRDWPHDRTGTLEHRQGTIVDHGANVFRYTGRQRAGGNAMINPGNVWEIPTASREGAEYQHFAMFPGELVERPILSSVPMGGLVLDPFAGTGTVGAVAGRLGRRAILVELDPRRLDDIVRRTVRGIDVAAAAAATDAGLFDEVG